MDIILKGWTYFCVQHPDSSCLFHRFDYFGRLRPITQTLV